MEQFLQHTSRDDDVHVHVQNVIATIAQTIMDGKWRTPDSWGYNEVFMAVSAIVSLHLEAAMRRRFGVGWIQRGCQCAHGRCQDPARCQSNFGCEIDGITRADVECFSTRRQSVDRQLRERAAEFEREHDRAPSQRELAQLHQDAWDATRKQKPEGAIDFDALHSGWAAKLRKHGRELESIAAEVWDETIARSGRRSDQDDDVEPDPGMRRRAPLIERERAAQLLGSDSATLAAQLDRKPEAGSEQQTATGLRLDQAAAIWSALTDRKTSTVLTGPAGSGKTHTLAAAALAARRAGARHIYATAVSQQARNVLAAKLAQMGVRATVLNSTQFLDRAARPVGDPHRLHIWPGSLILVDEASMLPDTGDGLRRAGRGGGVGGRPRRVRDEIIRLGVVGDGRSVPLAEGARASAGDLIINRKNDHKAGLANGDIVRVEAIEDDGLVLIRKATGRDPATGEPVFASKTVTRRSLRQFDSAYASTVHSKQGGQAEAGITVYTGDEDRQFAYTGLSRGTRENHAFVMSSSPRNSDPKAGPAPAPEIARHDWLERFRSGLAPAGPADQAQDKDAEQNPVHREAAAVLADIIARDCTELAATEYRRRQLANADHLAPLDSMWQDAITGPRGRARHRKRPGYGAPCALSRPRAWMPARSCKPPWTAGR